MKKITLSAAVLALTMVGCSESGLDNSVASTSASDVQNGQISKNTEFPFVLKKASAPVGCGTGMDWQSCESTYYHPYDGLRYTVMFSSGVRRDREADANLIVAVRDANNNIVNDSKADFVHIITVAVCGCRIIGNQLKCEDYYKSRYLPDANVVFTTNHGTYVKTNVTEPLSQCAADRIGTVSTFAAVYNAGSPAELVLAGNTFEGPMFFNMSDASAKNLATRVMQKYILEPYGN